MKYFLFVATIISCCLFSCKSEFSGFNDEALEFASNDKRIDQKEYESLLEIIKLSNDRSFTIFKTTEGKIENYKIVAYLLKLFAAKNLGLSSTDIWQPEDTSAKIEKFNINVYLENSASMDGYVKGVTEFETAIYNLLGDIKISGLCDSLNLNYINKSIPYVKKNALAPDIQDFIEKLEPATFQQRGGDRTASDLKNILSTVLTTLNKKNAAILISDFVFSPGRNANAQDYLNNQGVGIKIDFAEKLKAYDLAAVVIQLQSNFDGYYYDKMDKPIFVKCKRPYYIWILGNSQQIGAILGKKMLENVKGGYLNRLVFTGLKNINRPTFKIQYKPRIGDFDSKSLAQGIISGAKISNEGQNKGQFGFNVAVDFSKSYQDAGYFLDTANYELSDKKYNLKIENNIDNSNPALSGFTHILKLQTSEIREENLQINIIGVIPGWVNSSTSIDDTNIANDNFEKQKTFGFKYLVDGVCDAFYPKSNTRTMSSININIKK